MTKKALLFQIAFTLFLFFIYSGDSLAKATQSQLKTELIVNRISHAVFGPFDNRFYISISIKEGDEYKVIRANDELRPLLLTASQIIQDPGRTKRLSRQETDKIKAFLNNFTIKEVGGKQTQHPLWFDPFPLHDPPKMYLYFRNINPDVRYQVSIEGDKFEIYQVRFENNELKYFDGSILGEIESSKDGIAVPKEEIPYITNFLEYKIDTSVPAIENGEKDQNIDFNISYPWGGQIGFFWERPKSRDFQTVSFLQGTINAKKEANFNNLTVGQKFNYNLKKDGYIPVTVDLKFESTQDFDQVDFTTGIGIAYIVRSRLFSFFLGDFGKGAARTYFLPFPIVNLGYEFATEIKKGKDDVTRHSNRAKADLQWNFILPRDFTIRLSFAAFYSTDSNDKDSFDKKFEVSLNKQLTKDVYFQLKYIQGEAPPSFKFTDNAFTGISLKF